MTVRIRIPTPLRGYTAGAAEVDLEAATVAEAIAKLAARHEGIAERLLDEAGRPRAFVNLYVGTNDVRTLQGLATPLADGDVVSIVPAVAGGGR